MGCVMRHVDTYIDDLSQPECLRKFLHYNRLPATCKCAEYTPRLDLIEPELHQYIWTDKAPTLFADFEGKRVRVVMASRFGDVGITENLQAAHGYSKRVWVSMLSNFSASSAISS